MSYTTIKEVVETAGLFERVDSLESVGTGDGTTVAFTLAHNPVVSGTLSVYVAGTLKTETTNYTVNYTTGTITFVAGSIPTLGQAVTALYWFFPTGLDSTMITDFITDADALVDTYTGRSWATQTATAELYDGADFANSDTMYVRPDHTPIIAVSALSVDSTAITVATKIYVYNNEGKIRLKTDAEVTKFTDNTPQNVSITYTYGAASTPAMIANLSSHLAAAHAIRAVMGGSYDEANSWNLGSMAVTVGDNASKLGQTLNNIEADIKFMLQHIKKRVVVM